VKVKEITEAAYAGQRSVRNLLRFFIQDSGVDFFEWTEEEVEDEYGQFYKINEQFIGKWNDGVYHSGDVAGIGIGKHGASVFEESGSLSERIDEQELVQKIQIFAKPKRLF